MKISNVKMIEASDWDKLIEETYGRPYSFQQQNGCQSRGTYNLTVPSKDAEDFERETLPEVVNHNEMGISFKAWLARDPKQTLNSGRDEQWAINLWWERSFYPCIEILANDLYSKGLLEAGEYLINIDW